jgi:hypothetical protein
VGSRTKVRVESRENLWTYIQQQCALGHKANPYEVMVETMATTDDARLAVSCAKELATYLLPKLSSVTLRGDAEHPLTVYQVELD